MYCRAMAWKTVGHVRQLKSALDAFRIDRVDRLSHIVYDVDRFMSLNEKREIYEEIDVRRGRIRMIRIPPALLEVRAAEILLRTAYRHDPIFECEVEDWFEMRDLKADKIWVVNGETFVLVDPEHLGIHVQAGDAYNVLLHNPDGIIPFITNERTAQEVMSC